MTRSDGFALGLANLRETYVALARATPGSVVRSTDDGAVEAMGELAHPICNFVLLDPAGPGDARRLARMAAERPCLNVYLPTPDDRTTERRLRASGLRMALRLEIMVAPGRPFDESPEVGMREAETPEHRDRVARFMADQFFGRYRDAMRAQIARPTAESAAMRLFASPDCEAPRAAVLLTESTGALGLYNLCVRPEDRGRGVGSAIVRWVLAVAWAQGAAVTLQCDDRLVSWYRRFGFEGVGRLAAFSAPR